MYTLIWFIVIGFIIYKRVKVKETKDNRGAGAGSYPQGNSAPAKPQIPHYNKGNQQAKFSGQEQTAQSTATVHKKNKLQPKAQQAESGSTMAYLEEKARQDAREHAREKQEESKRLYENSGGRCVAERLYEGNSVPKGKQCVVCGYCGAENLIPTVPREKYSCYFCREPIN